MHGAPLEVEGQSMEEDPEAAGSGFAGLVEGAEGAEGPEGAKEIWHIMGMGGWENQSILGNQS